jgi:hypothetical protein
MFLNAAADLLAGYLGIQKIFNGDVYNTIAPTEKLITLAIYISTVRTKALNKYFIIGIVMVILLSIWGYARQTVSGMFHHDVFIISGFVLAILSYAYMRDLMLNQARPFTPLFWFSFANMIYYTMMVASISAMPVALRISYDFAAQIHLGNDLAYILWSTFITFGIVWNQKKP